MSTAAEDWLKAADPNTPAEELTRIARAGVFASRVAQNPNTPKETLVMLARTYPSEVLRNPAWPLLLIEAPGLVEGLPYETTCSLVSCADAPQDLLDWAIADGRFEAALAKNPRTPVALLKKFCLYELVDIRKPAMSNPSLPKEFKDLLLRCGIQPTLVHISHTYDPSVSSEELASLFLYRRLAISACAQHPNTPRPLLEELAKESTNAFSLARNPSLPLEILMKYAHSAGEELKAVVLKNPAFPQEQLEQNASHGSNYLRGAVARNPAASKALLEKLAQDKEPSVRCGVAENPSTTLEILLQLAKDTRVQVRRALAMRKPLPEEVFRRLSKEKDSKLKASLARNPSNPKKSKAKKR